MKYRFLGKKKILWFVISGLIISLGVASLVIWKLKFGIDFKGGTQIEITTEKSTSTTGIKSAIDNTDKGKSTTVTSTKDGSYILRAPELNQDEKKQIIAEIEKSTGKVTEKESITVGPTVSKDLTTKAIWAVVIASLLIIFYLAYSFREVTKPISSWRFGVTAVAALLHDLVVTVGVFAVCAHYFKYEIDASFIPALLTVMGFSVHDTIVVFDRIRENLIGHKGDADLQFEHIADVSLDQTLNRSLATSLTVIFTLTALVILGGETIRPFALTLLVGVTVGTYSSIFTATPLLVIWQNALDRRKLAQK